MTPLSSSLGSSHSAHIVEGWIASLLLHSAAVLFGVVLVTAVKLAPEPKPFQWDVSVVQSQMADPVANQTPSPATPASLAQHHIDQPAESTPPAEEPPVPEVTVIRPTTTVAAVVQQTTRATEPARKPVVIETKPAPAIVPSVSGEIPRTPDVEKAIATPVEPVSQLPVVEAPVKQRPVQDPPVGHMEVKPVAEPPPRAAIPSISSDPVPTQAMSAAAEAPSQVAALTPASAAAATASKPDRGWLSELLFKRVEQLKQYPSLARVDRLEGKVIVRATLHENGQLSDVEVLKSSGHDILDRAAIQVLQEASPLQLPRPLGNSAVPIKVPISYSLIDSLNSAK